jgi:hypothetical protein
MKINWIKKKCHKNNTEALLEASMEAGLEVITKEVEYVVTSHNQNAGKNHNLLIHNKSVEM